MARLLKILEMSLSIKLICQFAIFAVLLFWLNHTQAEFSARLKWYGGAVALPADDLQRSFSGTPALDTNLDMRLMFEKKWSNFSFSVDHTTLYLHGDSFEFGGIGSRGGPEQQSLENNRQLLNLTWNIAKGDQHQVLHGIDRLALRYRTGKWGVTLGREALSWGSGIVFQPMDIFNPFAPTAVDRDYKGGDDLILVERLFNDGSDLQVLAVARRDSNNSFSGGASSIAAKYHGFIKSGEYELMVARHFAEEIYGLSLRWPIGGAMFRGDVVTTRLDTRDLKFMAVANLDFTTVIGKYTTYFFVEYFHSDFGVQYLPETIESLPSSLVNRLERGELFNVMRDYLALGMNIQWHPLVSQNGTLIINLEDGSGLVQSQFTYEISQRQRLELGLVVGVGEKQSEFGGIPTFRDPLTSEFKTIGGDTRGYLRWIYYL